MKNLFSTSILHGQTQSSAQHPGRTGFRPAAPPRGIVLVTVLCLLALIVALALGIYYSAKIERRLSAQFSAALDGQRPWIHR